MPDLDLTRSLDTLDWLDWLDDEQRARLVALAERNEQLDADGRAAADALSENGIVLVGERLAATPGALSAVLMLPVERATETQRLSGSARFESVASNMLRPLGCVVVVASGGLILSSLPTRKCTEVGGVKK